MAFTYVWYRNWILIGMAYYGDWVSLNLGLNTINVTYPSASYCASQLGAGYCASQLEAPYCASQPWAS